MAHTPGPWQWYASDHEIADRLGDFVAEVSDCEPENLRLILAAPDLLYACRDALDRLNGVDPENLSERSRAEWTALHRTLSAAIAKATTEVP